MTEIKMAKLTDFLTRDEIERAVKLYVEATPGTFAPRCEAEIVKPILARINTTLGQENHAKFIAYAIEFALMDKRPPAPSVRR